MSEQFTSKTYSDLYEKVDRLKSLLSEALPMLEDYFEFVQECSEVYTDEDMDKIEQFINNLKKELV